jgi:hypothetical protein
MIHRTGRIRSVIVLALAAAFAGCDGNQSPVTPVTPAGEPAAAKAGPPGAPSPAAGKAKSKIVPRSEGKR